MSVDRSIERVKDKEIERLVQWLNVGDVSWRARSRLIRATGALPTTPFGKTVADGKVSGPTLETLERCVVCLL